MNLKSLLLVVAITLSSCAYQREAAETRPGEVLVQDSFYGARFRNSPKTVQYRMAKYHPISGLMENTLFFANMSFGGYDWQSLEMRFVDDMLYGVYFHRRFANEDTANQFYDSFLRTLVLKYPEMAPMKNSEGYSYTDSRDNSVSFNVQFGTSKAGEEGWFCSLRYTFGAGAALNSVKAIDEL